MPEGQAAADHPDYAAIQAILEDTTPEEKAEGFKVRGHLTLPQASAVRPGGTHGASACVRASSCRTRRQV